MSLESLPDEVLLKILYGTLVNDDPISTSIEAHDIYEAYLVSLDHNDEDEDYLINKSTHGFTQRRPVLSALLLGICKRWYRLGCPLFYRYNTFVVMYYDTATFAKQIGVHNSAYLRKVELTVHHQDPNPGETIPLLPETQFEHVGSFNIILARREKMVCYHGSAQISAMRWRAQYLKGAIHQYARSSEGKWAVVKPDLCLPVVRVAHGSSVWSAFWVVKRISTPSKVWTKNKLLSYRILTRIEDAVLGEPNVLEGSPRAISPGGKENTVETVDLDASTFSMGLSPP